ncbi:disease resistance protein SUMM2-like [Eucalyptus grandis]|uniref:disease resistance protein SUMM2-like n=1 Tax=Eucalyptus grandis TaxID=71139 RepID=UPI00192F0424|nr:disease resistance protein SUMM2-like [Eucalyptus grandis]
MVGIIAAVTSPPPHPLPFFPSLEQISITYCNKMKRAVESEWMPHFPSLRIIRVSGCKKMEEIIRGPPPYSPDEQISLESLEVSYCDNMRKLLTYEWLLHLRNLQSIKVNGCKGMVELISGAGQGQEGSITTSVNNTPSSFQPSSISLPKLECLELCNLHQLKSIYEAPISCDFMKRLDVYGCPELKRIPLQLRLCEIEELPYIVVEDEEKWKMLMWDHPDAQAILQPYLRKVHPSNFIG